MQTFLPFSSFSATAASLDWRRLGKQRSETKQVLLALGLPVGEHQPKFGWSNHPAVRMWRGYEMALVSYGIAICAEWRGRGYNDTVLPQFQKLLTKPVVLPPWLGDEDFHRAHRSNLKRKDGVFYAKFQDVTDDLEYIWPL